MATYLNGKLISRRTLPAPPGSTRPPGSRLPVGRTMQSTGAREPGEMSARRREELPCVHLGAETGERLDCQGCGGAKDVPVRACAVHGECSGARRLVVRRDGRSHEYPCCLSCKDYRGVGPTRRVRVDEALAGGGPMTRFNASLHRWRGRLLLAYRTGWKGAQIHVAPLSEDLTPAGPESTLNLWHPRCGYGREDPRFFEHAGSLWVSFIGVRGRDQVADTHQMLARLDDDLTVADVTYPHYDARRGWEKNWAFFSHGGDLLAVYDVHPHTVLRVEGDRALPAFRQDWPIRWAGGALRGGASPVLVGDEYWCWAHGKIEPRYMYSLGVYTFDAKPPFRPRRVTPQPLYWADRGTQPPGQYAPVVFPCGAVLDGDRWRVSCGIHDRWIEVLEFDHRQVEKAMVSV